MFPYWVLFSAYAFAAINHGRQSIAVRSTPLFWVAAIAMALMIGLRYETGGDWFNYIDIFDYSAYTNLATTLALGDPGYMLLNWTGQRLGFEIWFVNLACGLIFTWGLLKFSERQPNPWLSIAIAIPYLVIVVAMGYTRQGVAIGLLMAGLAAFDRGSLVRFIVYTILAATFHKSAIVIIPLVALATVRYRLAIYAVIFGLGFILFTLFLEIFLARLMTNYIDSQMESEGTAIRIAMNVVPALIYLFLQKRFALNEQERKLWRNFSLAALAALAALIVLPSSTVVDRIALYFIPLQLFVFSRLPYAFPLKGRPNGQLTLAVLIYSAAIQYIWLTQANHAHAWLPYRNFVL